MSRNKGDLNNFIKLILRYGDIFIKTDKNFIYKEAVFKVYIKLKKNSKSASSCTTKSSNLALNHVLF